MGTLTLHPDHLLAQSHTGEEPVWPASIYDLSTFFFYSVEVDPGFTMGDLIRLLDRDGIEFLEAVIGESITPLLDEAGEPPDESDTHHIEYLRVYNVYEEGQLLREFDGWGAWDEPYPGAWAKNPESPREGAVSVSLTPVNQLLAVPLRYDPELIFHDTSGAEEYRTHIQITLIEFIKAIFYDLTFYGTPDERDEVLADLKRRVEEIDRGDVELIPAEEVFEQLRRRLRFDEES